jgi:hypothetical protein
LFQYQTKGKTPARLSHGCAGNSASGLFLARRWCVGIKNLELSEALVVRNFESKAVETRQLTQALR